jgi:hypothetical protein
MTNAVAKLAPLLVDEHKLNCGVFVLLVAVVLLILSKAYRNIFK